MSDFPHTRKVGRYAFYASCAFSLAVFGTFLLMQAGMKDEMARSAVFPIFFVAFLALRDIEKNAARTALTAIRAGEAS